jgi:hypothetical protein
MDRRRGSRNSRDDVALPPSENKTVPVGAITELVEGDVYHGAR